MLVRLHISLASSGLAVCSALVLMLGGCGQGEYESRMGNIGQMMAARQAALVNNLVMKEYFPVTDPTNAPSGVKLRLPLKFSGGQATSLGADIARAKLAQFDIPGFCYTLETMVADDAGKQLPTTLHLYVVSKKTTTAQQLRDSIKQQAVVVSPEANWVLVPAGKAPGALAGNMIAVTGNFDFEMNGTIENLPGTIRLYMYETPENIVILGFRHDSSTGNEKGKLALSIAFALSSVALDVPAPAPAAAAPAAGS
ncbi:hypothetical protein ETAA8_36520 [Anatilimnocola aggregata]|uniref:Uncharacterized protein n=1 Tax=Anatilimnocola aggregata TaxID=2528021 RepID=A0A517YE86_9BACT|nr:hypothetical protein [Anatilimnocola aggregata]QDU28549.1 hypothetical protein ETAA8_36520 [Anatilimnocola aggregata]